MLTTLTSHADTGAKALIAKSGESLAITALLVLGFASTYKLSTANTALGALLLATLLNARPAYRVMSREPYFWVTIAYLVYLLFSATRVTLSGNPHELPVWDITADYVKMILLPGLLVGYWFSRHPRLIDWVLMLIPLGLVARVIVKWEENNGAAVLALEDRATFGDSAVKFGLWSLVVTLIGLYFVARTLPRASEQWRQLSGAVPFLAAVSCATFGLAGVLFSHTRAAWALTAVLVPTYLIALAILCAPTGARLRVGLSAVGGTAMLAIAVWFHFQELIRRRWADVQEPLALLFQGRWSEAGANSLGYRMHMLVDGWHAWIQRPLFGFGPGADRSILDESHFEPVVSGGFSHFHNAFAGFSVELGLFGLTFLILSFAFPLWYLFRALKLHSGTGATMYILAALIISAFFISSLSTNPMASYRGPYILAIVVGVLLAPNMNRPDSATRIV